MKQTRKFALAALAAAALVPGASRATIIAEDSFSYTVGESMQDQAGGTGWSGGWTVTSSTNGTIYHHVSTGLDQTGGALNLGSDGASTGGNGVIRNLATPVSTGVVWLSVLVRGNYVDAGDFFINTTAQFETSVGKKWGSEFSLANDGSGGLICTQGDIHLLLWKIDIDGGLTSLWVNPADQSSEVNLGTPDNTKSWTIDPVDQVAISVQRYNTAPNYDFDDIRLGTDLVDVANTIPTPGPPAPDPVSPTDAATGVLLDTQLEWTSLSATEWDLYFWMDGDTPLVPGVDPPTAENITTASYNPGAMDVLTTYHWQVVATNANGDTTGDPWSFTTSDGVVAVLPPDGVDNVPLDLPLEWTADNGATSWDLYLWKDGEMQPGTPTAAGLTDPSYDPGDLDASTVYYWELVSYYDAGGPTTSITFSFTTGTGVPGELLLRDNFEGYTPGPLATSDVSGQTGQGLGQTGDWALQGLAATWTIEAGLQGSQGLTVVGTAGDGDIKISHTVPNWGSGVLYMSFLYQESRTVGHFYVSGGGSFAGAFGHPWAQSWAIDNAGYGVGYNHDQTYRVVEKIDWDTNTTTMWVDPTYEFDAPVALKGAVQDGSSTFIIRNYDNDGMIDDIRIGTDFASVTQEIIDPTNEIKLEVSLNAGMLDFSWNSQDGMLYDLLASTTLDNDWTPVAGQTEIPADVSGTTTTSIPLPGDPATFYAVYEYPPVLLEKQTFEDDNGGFAVDPASTGTPWEWDAPDSNNGLDAVVDAGNNASLKCWAVNPGDVSGTGDEGYYNTSTNAGLRTPPLDFTAVAGATLNFAQALDINPGDTAVVNFLDADAGNAVVGSETIVDGDPDFSAWEPASIAVPAAVIGEDNIIIEWRLTFVGGDGYYLGWYVDDVEVVGN